MSALIRMMKKIEGGEAFGGEVETGKAKIGRAHV